MSLLLDALIIISLFVIPALIWYGIKSYQINRYYEQQSEQREKCAGDEQFRQAVVADRE